MPVPDPADLDSAKSDLRTKILARRDALSIEQRIQMSLSMTEVATVGEKAESVEGELPQKVFAELFADHAPIVAGFFPIRSEIDPRPLMTFLSGQGARLCLPVVISKTEIEFRELTKETELVSSGFGTMGPGEGAAVLDPHTILVPLSAFDRSGGRLGYGAGFYDRAIVKLRDHHADTRWPLLCGIAFSCQEVDHVPMELHDQHLDYMLTENELIICSHSKSRQNETL